MQMRRTAPKGWTDVRASALQLFLRWY